LATIFSSVLYFEERLKWVNRFDDAQAPRAPSSCGLKPCEESLKRFYSKGEQKDELIRTSHTCLETFTPATSVTNHLFKYTKTQNWY